MSQAVKQRRIEQRTVITMSKIAHAARTIQQKQAKGSPIEKARQELARRQFNVNRGGIYDL